MDNPVGITTTGSSFQVSKNSSSKTFTSATDVYPVYISAERAAFVLLKVLSRRSLTMKEYDSLSQVMGVVNPIIGEGASKLLMKHIIKNKLIFKDEELLEKCIEKLQLDIDSPPVISIFTNDNHFEQSQDIRFTPYTDEVIVTSENTGSSGDATLEKPETSGTIG